ncbi:MAG TPA: hypothetical protein VNS34_01070 [Rhizobiaceae bacterium]|nr:hypothetical protein [Rhizobiaceae bacterium]
MKATVALALGFSLLALDAQAISRYNSQTMSCARIQETIRREGAVILSYTGRGGAPLYDRYVADSAFCSGMEITRVASVPASDTGRCLVYRCFQKSHDT